MDTAANALQSPTERVYRAIFDAVQAQHLVPGYKLKEVELTSVFKVSRTSVRSALLRLAHKGLVQLSANRGAVVAQMSADDCRQLFEARRAVERSVVEILAKARDPAVISTLRKHVAAQRSAFRSGDKATGHRYAIAFHQRMAELTGNNLLAQFMDDLLARMPLVILTLGAPQPTSDSTHAEHIALVEAIAAGQVALARQIVARHLDHLEAELNSSRPQAPKSLAEVFGAVE